MKLCKEKATLSAKLIVMIQSTCKKQHGELPDYNIGLDWTADVESSFFSKVNSVCDVVGKSSIFS